jgi:myo-inositol-1(or 4)-monophosphatase
MAPVGADERELMDVAERVAAEAAELVREAWEGMARGREVGVETKSGETDVVTAVDLESERLIRARLAELRPGDGIVGEEGGAGESTGDGPGQVTWVVDPIDGTVNFLYGLPWFAVSVAAQVDGESVAGAVVEPASGRRWTAARGHGSWLDGRRLAVTGPERLEVTLVATGFAYNAERRVRQARFAAELLGRVRDIRRPGAGSLDLCAVAAGWVDASVEHGLSRWDWAAGALIASEAGAVVSVSGADPALGPDATFAAAPSIAQALREALIASGAADV